MGSWTEELLEEGEKRVTVLVSCLIRDNRIEELKNLEENKEKLFKEYNL